MGAAALDSDAATMVAMSSVFEGDGWDDSGLIRAAGGIVLRWQDGRQELLLVHRLAYGDWSLPKGKLASPQEAAEDTAVREVREETGLVCEIEFAAGSTRYRDQNGQPKVVRYWEMSTGGGAFVANAEVDQMLWLAVPEAIELLSYAHDRELIERRCQTGTGSSSRLSNEPERPSGADA